MSEVNDSSAALEQDSGLTGTDGSKENSSGAQGGVNSNVAPSPPPRKSKIPAPEVAALPKRRRFSADYKARIVEEAEGCTESGAIGALLRREGLFSSHLSEWRKLYRAGRDDHRDPKKKSVRRYVSRHQRLNLESRSEESRQGAIGPRGMPASFIGSPPLG